VKIGDRVKTGQILARVGNSGNFDEPHKRRMRFYAAIGREGNNMNAFPQFMKDPANRIRQSSQATPGVEGYVFDGVNGTQMAFWTCAENATSAEHAHDYDEYMVVVGCCYTMVIGGHRIPLKAGEEYVIPQGVLHGGEVVAGTRTIHAFGGHRAERELTNTTT
jgi:mannose-6-phosphate isomerase-like protein (cupin superfamily)